MAIFQTLAGLTTQIQDFFGKFAAVEAHEHVLLFSAAIHVRDRTLLNARLHVPLVLADDVPLTAFHLRIIDNDTTMEVRVS